MDFFIFFYMEVTERFGLMKTKAWTLDTVAQTDDLGPRQNKYE